jgi:signal transduction histidine kinase
MTWWIYLYIFAVMAWQYVVPNIAAYDGNLNFLYLIEKLAFLSGLFVAWVNSRGGWKLFYANLFGASLTYAFSSYLANWAIGRHAYYSGSLYDIPLVFSMAWITPIALWSPTAEPQAGQRPDSTSPGVWLARVGMIAVFSLPLLAALALFETTIPPRIRSFRLVLTLGAALFMGVMVFVRQRRLDRELLRLLAQSRESLANLKRLQAQITESEKLASMGQLVAGAAHELNNPITAMMGYSDLLLTTSLNHEQHGLAAAIGQHVRQTRVLVATLLSFAKHGPSTMTQLDLRTVLQTAVKLSESVCQSRKIELTTDLQADLPPILGDSNQLLQVFVQTLNCAANAAEQNGIRNLTLSTEHTAGSVIVNVFEGSSNAALGQSSEKPGNENSGVVVEPSGPPSGLGLSACQSILQQHRGRVSWQSGNTGLVIRVELPTTPPLEKSSAAAPAMWNPQSFA